MPVNRIKVLNDQESLEWAKERWKEIPTDTQCILIGGNEDSPEYIDCFKSTDPFLHDIPFHTITFTKEN